MDRQISRLIAAHSHIYIFPPMQKRLTVFVVFLSFQSFSIQTQVPAHFLSIHQAADIGGSPGKNPSSDQFSAGDGKQIHRSRRRTRRTTGEISHHHRFPTGEVAFIKSSSVWSHASCPLGFTFAFVFFLSLCSCSGSGPVPGSPLLFWRWVRLPREWETCFSRSIATPRRSKKKRVRCTGKKWLGKRIQFIGRLYNMQAVH